jgi:FtsZ-interacting cell division protein YlmF
MASAWQRALFYLGLVDEDEPGYESGASPQSRAGLQAGPPYPEPGYDEQSGVRPGRRVEPVIPTEVRSGRRVEPPMGGGGRRRTTTTEGALTDAGVILNPVQPSNVRTVTTQDLETEVITARSYADAQQLADHIRLNQPVVLDLRKVEPAMVRRLVDFASGLTYALGGTMRKIGQGVILVTPANVNVSRDERRRLQSLGYYQVPEGT